jgi:hypothetical protein
LPESFAECPLYQYYIPLSWQPLKITNKIELFIQVPAFQKNRTIKMHCVLIFKYLGYKTSDGIIVG